MKSLIHKPLSLITKTRIRGLDAFNTAGPPCGEPHAAAARPGPACASCPRRCAAEPPAGPHRRGTPHRCPCPRAPPPYPTLALVLCPARAPATPLRPGRGPAPPRRRPAPAGEARRRRGLAWPRAGHGPSGRSRGGGSWELGRRPLASGARLSAPLLCFFYLLFLADNS